jgi:peptide/nickel transport system permease protein
VEVENSGMAKKISSSLVYIFLIVLLSFALPRLIPGSPLFVSGSDLHVLNAQLPEETFQVFREHYTPDRPLAYQFGLYVCNLVRLDLGSSFYYRLPVTEIIAGHLVWTFFLSMTSLGLSTLVGIPLGLALAYRGRRRNIWALNFFMVIQSIPVFVLAVLMQLAFCFRFNIFPSGGAYTPGLQADFPTFALNVLTHTALPLLVLVLVQLPPIVVLTYNVCSKVRGEAYVEMAYYFNVREGLIRSLYVLRNSLPEILAKLNIQVLAALSGVLFVEVVFSYPGLGSLLKVASSSRDYPLLQGLLLITGVYGVLVNLTFDLLVKKVSPRFRT